MGEDIFGEGLIPPPDIEVAKYPGTPMAPPLASLGLSFVSSRS